MRHGLFILLILLILSDSFRTRATFVWRAHGLKPHLSRTFKVSNDIRFEEKLTDIVGSRFHMHFTATSASWMNMVERFFRNLSEDRLKRGVFKSVDELIAAIELFVLAHNENPKPFIWTKNAKDILEKVMRAKAKLKTVQTA